ncbi:MAG: cation:proton antiporter [Hormoscilla sp. SP12CHS1]|nr:cation:proton antiporter [Hormoscilla sp. SP12CHS1]
MEAPFDITVLMVITVMAGIGAQVLGKYLKVPGIVFLLLFGILLGPDGLSLIHPQLLGDGLEVIVSLSVALILFEGGLNLQVRDLSKISSSLRNLVTIGPIITLIGGGVAAHFLAEFPWPLAFLYASLVVVTGPTVIGPLLKQVQVDRQVATLLESEGVLIDPVGAILAVLVLDVVLNGGDADPQKLLTGLVIRLGIGTAIGASGGWALGQFLKQADILSEELKNLVVLAGLWGLYGFAQYIRDESGLMTTVVGGLVQSAANVPELRNLRRFKGQLTVLAVSVLFILLAADLSLASIVALGWGSLLTVLVLMFLVRPLCIWMCTLKSGFNWRQKLFLSWIGPKGGESIKALVFLTIMMTVVMQGLTAQLVASLLQVTATGRQGAVIVGSNPLARLIARMFQERDESVVLIDTNAAAVKQAENENLRVFLSSAMDTQVLEEAGLESMGTFLAMTKNGEVNFVLAQRAAEEFDPPRVLAVFPKNPQLSTALLSCGSLKSWGYSRPIHPKQFLVPGISCAACNC